METLKVSLGERGVLTITLNRPQVKNAFNQEMIKDLVSIFTHYSSNDHVRVVVLQGAGSVFCAGGDLEWMKQSVHFSYEENLQDIEKLAQMFLKINKFQKPVIGIAQGAAIGGGVGLLSVCDIVISKPDTQFSFSEAKLGIVPACIAPFVIAKIGLSHTRSLFLSSERISASHAFKIGLVHEVAEDVSASLDRMINSLICSGPNALIAAKKLISYLAGDVDMKHMVRVLAELRVSPEGQEGVSAFLEKRKPSWVTCYKQ